MKRKPVKGMGAARIADIKSLFSTIERHNATPVKAKEERHLIVMVVAVFIATIIIAAWGGYTASHSGGTTIIVTETIIHFDNRNITAPIGWNIVSETRTSIQFKHSTATVRINLIESDESYDMLTQRTVDVFRVLSQPREPNWIQPEYRTIQGKQWVYFEGQDQPEYYHAYVLCEPNHSYQIIGISKDRIPDLEMEKFPILATR